MFTTINKEPSDPSAFIMPVVGQLNNWTWDGFSKSEEKKSAMQVPMYFSTFSIK